MSAAILAPCFPVAGNVFLPSDLKLISVASDGTLREAAPAEWAGQRFENVKASCRLMEGAFNPANDPLMGDVAYVWRTIARRPDHLPMMWQLQGTVYLPKGAMPGKAFLAIYSAGDLIQFPHWSQQYSGQSESVDTCGDVTWTSVPLDISVLLQSNWELPLCFMAMLTGGTGNFGGGTSQTLLEVDYVTPDPP